MVAACSNGDDSTGPGTISPPSQPGPTSYEAGANCASTEDCNTGLVCLFPASACNTLAVCVVAPPTPCDHPQSACSCLGEVIQVCDGYATSQVDTTATCEGGGVIAPIDGGADSTAAPPAEAGSDAAPDASPGTDASDASDAAGD